MTHDANTPHPGSWSADGPFISGTNTSMSEAIDADDLPLPLYEAWFGEAVTRFFKKYATFSGRASRSEYWWAALFTGMVYVVSTVIMLVGLSGGSGSASAHGAETPDVGGLPGLSFAFFLTGLILTIVWFLATVVPFLAVSWRRLHDANLAGPFYFVTFIPNVGSVVLLVLMLLPSKPEGQRFDV